MMKRHLLLFLFVLTSGANAQEWTYSTTNIFFTNSNQDTISNGALDTSSTIVLVGNVAGDDSIAVLIAVRISLEFPAASDGDADVKILTSQSGTTWDTNQTPFAQFVMTTPGSNTTRVRTFLINPGPRFMRVEVKNNETGARNHIVRGWVEVTYSLDNL